MKRLTASLLAATIALFALSGCMEDEVRVGSKNFTESRIVAEMLRALLEDRGIRTVRVPAFTEQGAAFASLRVGTIDVYPDYVGTLLGRLGMTADMDRAEARALVEVGLAELGIVALAPIGFDDGYVAVTTRNFARDENISRIEDLADVSRPLRVGVSQGFARRPQNGLEAAIDRYGLQDAEITVASASGRAALYDDLVEGKIDVVVGFRTDPQIRDYKLLLLGPSEREAPNYDAIPLIRAELLAARPEIGEALDDLAGRIDTEAMRQLLARVDLDGVPPRTVARDALSELGLIARPTRRTPPPLGVAMEAAEIGDVPAIRTMRAARLAAPGRDIDPVAEIDPVAAVLSGAARIALVPAVALFDPDVQPPTLKPGIVSLAAPSSSFAHMLALVDAPPGPGARIATGPVGSPSYGLARLAARWLPEDIELVPLDRTDAATAVEALVDGRADRALVLASLGRSDIDEVMATGQIRLEDWSGWLRGSAGLVLSFLRDAVIADGIYGPGQARTSTVSMQMVVVGPAPTDRVLGRAGPLTFSQDILPIPDKVVLDFNTHLGLTADVAPQLSPASVLAPRPLSESAPLNPDPGATALSMGILVFLIWAAWLLVRPPREEEP